MSENARAVTLAASLDQAGVLPYGLQDIEEMRLVLEGSSVIDWRRLAFRDYEQIDEFLRLLGFRPEVPADGLRLADVHQRAVSYLDSHFERRLGPEVRQPGDVRDLFLLASRNGNAQQEACIVLKVMHVIHHATGRELLYRLPVPLNVLFHRVEQQVFDAVDLLRSCGVRISEFASSRKSADSIYTKLLARSDSLTASVHDRLRFRLVTETIEDLFLAIIELLRVLVPFNYVVPGASRNDLIDLSATLAADPRSRGLLDLLQQLAGDPASVQSVSNKFSGSGYRVINFVVDIPVRVDDLVLGLRDHAPRDGDVVFLLIEFQLLDRETDRANNVDDNRHDLYKSRQYRRVMERLSGNQPT